MAPSPENDNAPKAPDKSDKTKAESSTTVSDPRTQDLEIATVGPENKEASVSRLDDVQLKALLDEAINYKIPKDRVGKSKLFQNLLEKAEEDDRKARATSASGSESVRYYNTTATHRTRRRREPSSVSENLTHGGSLNNLAKEELYAATNHLHRPTKTVSTRQRQGGSLPCNVNAGITPSYDKQFFEEARRKMENKKAEYTAIDMESESLLEHDSLNQDYNEQPDIEVVQTRIPRIPMKFTSRFNLEIGGGGGGSSNVDDAVSVSALDRTEKVIDNEVSYKPVETITAATHYPAAAHYSLLMPSPMWPPFNRKSVEDKKVDENGNALGQANSDTKKNKKKKIQTDKNVVVLEAKDVAGHRSDIIDDLDKLVEYIGGNEEQTGAKSKSNVHKTKFHKQHFSSSGDDKNTNNNKKQRTRSKVKAEKLQKSNSLEEISVSKLDDFSFSKECDANKVQLRSTKSNADRPRERRSWGNSESLPLHASAENLETADFRVVTKKKKSKKRRNSISGRRQPYLRDSHDNDFNRVPSPEPRRKSACSVPHSDKSNDSSDIDSVHSLPIDTEHMNIDSERLNSTNLNLPISYADIAKNSNSLDRPKWNRLPSERKSFQTKAVAVDKNNDKTVCSAIEPIECINKVEQEKPQPTKVKTGHNTTTQSVQTSPKLQNFVQMPVERVHPSNLESRPAESICTVVKNSPPDVHNLQNWPAIQNNNNNNNNNKNSSPTVVINKNNQNMSHKVIQNKNSPNNIKNNLKNVHQQKSEKIVQHQQQQHQQCISNMVTRSNNTLPNNIHVEAAVQLLQNTDQICITNVQVLPHNIPDVQTIEKMHFKQLQQAMQQHNAATAYVPHNVQDIISNHIVHIPQGGGAENYVPGFNSSASNVPHEQSTSGNRVQCIPANEIQTIVTATVVPSSDNCDSDRTSSRPAVVILSGDGKEVSGLTFGFDINEQLLSDDVCDNFTARFYVPDIFQHHNHDKIVNFIGMAWEDTINEINGKVKYFSDQL